MSHETGLPPRRVSPVQKEPVEAAKRPYNESHRVQQSPNADFAGVELPEKKQAEESTIDWFARSLSKPNPSELADMMRWTEKTMIGDNIVEYQMRWISKSLSVLNKLDGLTQSDPHSMKKTMLLIVMADYLGTTRKAVFERSDTSGRLAFGKWMKKPELRSVFEEMHGMMEEEVLNHELAEVSKATTITRISAGRAAEVRMQLLEHPNPWVQLQAARDIMQAADRATASKGGKTNLNISATLSETQVDQLLRKAGEELRGWEDIAPAGHADGRPVVIIEQESAVDEKQLKELAERSSEKE